jgi:PKHD-type hydroxylase
MAKSPSRSKPAAQHENSLMSSSTMHAAWAEVFTPEEMDRIERYGDSQRQDKAALLGEVAAGEQDAIRITRTAWLQANEETNWIYRRIQECVMALNEKAFRYALTGYAETLQYSVYHASERGHYDWHVDQGPLQVRRKLSVSVQLSDPSAYEGGALEFAAGRYTESAPKDRGMLIAFPSFVTHRVAPVTTGTRKSLVVWITGPAFR